MCTCVARKIAVALLFWPKVVSVAAAPDHTVVLCAASCPSLPHGASFACASPRSDAHVQVDEAIGEEADEDAEIDLDSEEEAEGLALASSTGRFEPLTLKQACEAKLAQEVDLHNAGALLAYAVGRSVSAVISVGGVCFPVLQQTSPTAVAAVALLVYGSW